MQHKQLRVGDDGELQGGKFCTHCGTINSLHASYCAKCGYDFNEPIPLYFPERHHRTFLERLSRSTLLNSVVGILGIKLTVLFGGGTAILLILAFASAGNSPHRPASVTPIRMYSPYSATTVAKKPEQPTMSSPYKTATVAVKPGNSKSFLVDNGMLPNYPDSACVAQMGKATIAVNYKTAADGQGVALISDDGTRLCRLTLVTGDQSLYDYEPHWLPNGQIAFNSTQHNDMYLWQANVYIMDPKSAGFRFKRLLPDMPFSQPSWSPNGKYIAFISDDGFGSNFNVYLVSSDGSELRKLTNTGSVNWLTWSPDSQWIYFYDAGERQLSKIAVNGSPIIPVFSDSSSPKDWRFALSPDGKSIAATSVTAQNNIALDVISADGINRSLVPLGSTLTVYPTLYPTPPSWLGDMIVFVASDNTGKQGLYKMRSDGSGVDKFYQGPEDITSVAVRMPSIMN